MLGRFRQKKKKNFCDTFYDNDNDFIDFFALFNTSTMNGYSEQRNITMVIHNEIRYKLMKMSFETDLDKTEVVALFTLVNVYVNVGFLEQNGFAH